METVTAGLATASTSLFSLTVTLDLRTVSSPVDAAFGAVLDALCAGGISGDEAIARMEDALVHGPQSLSPADTTAFVGLVGTVFHELHHVHDLLGTYVGADLMLRAAAVYADAEELLAALANWTAGDAQRAVPVPADAAWLDRTFPGRGYGDALTSIKARLAALNAEWLRPDTSRTVPGVCVRDIYEGIAFLAQMDLTASIFGEAAAEQLMAATALGETLDRYGEATRRVMSVMPVPPQDPSDLNALLMAAVDELPPAVPDAGFGPLGPVGLVIELADHFARIQPFDDRDLGLVNVLVEDFFGYVGDPRPRSERIRERRTSLDAGRHQVLSTLADGPAASGVAGLLAADIPVTYSELLGLRLDPNSGYHDGASYVAMTVAGIMPAASLVVHHPDGRTTRRQTRSDNLTDPACFRLADDLHLAWELFAAGPRPTQSRRASQRWPELREAGGDATPRLVRALS